MYKLLFLKLDIGPFDTWVYPSINLGIKRRLHV